MINVAFYILGRCVLLD